MRPANVSTWAVVPVKTFARGKSRLGPVLSEDVRSAFARGLFDHVVTTLKQHEALAGVLVVTNGEDVALAAGAHGVSVLRDPSQSGLSAVVDAGLEQVHARGASAGLVCMTDLPHLTLGDVTAVIGELACYDLVIAPDLRRTGTNALCMTLATRIPSCFGRTDSFAQHLLRAQAASLRVRIVERHGLSLDIDIPSDLEKASAAANLPWFRGQNP